MNPGKYPVPIGWSETLLEGLTERGSGHTPNRKNASYWNGGVKWVSLVDSDKLDRPKITTTEFEISNEGIRNSSAVRHPAGTVIMSRDAGVGKSSILGTEMAVSQHFIAWRCSDDLENRFLYYWLQFHKGYFERMAVGSTIKTIGLPLFRKLLITAPDQKNEQEKIADILETWDRAIEFLADLIRGKARRKRSLTQQLLSGAKRLPAFTKEWQEVRLGDLLTESRISGSAGDTARKLTVRWYGNGVVPKKDALAVGSQNTRYYRRKAGQLIYSKLDLIRGAVAILPSEYDGWETTLDLPAFDISDAAAPAWLSQLVSWPNFTRKFKDFEQGGRKAARIAPRDFCRVFVAVPPIEEQRRIAEILEACDREIALHRHQLEAIREQKRGLMQKLLTGEVRVKV